MVLALLVAAAAAGTSHPAVPPLFSDPALAAALGEVRPTPGAWAEYLVRAQTKGDLRVRATALDAGESGKFWLELASASEAGIASAARVLVHGKAFAPGNVERMYVMVLGQQPIEVPPDQIQAGASGPPAKRAAKVTHRGTERIRVPAGEFTAELFTVAGTRVWRSETVPLWGLVRARSADRSVELVSFDTKGGHSLFPAGWSQGNGSESRK
jgi:hypothetical protein